VVVKVQSQYRKLALQYEYLHLEYEEIEKEGAHRRKKFSKAYEDYYRQLSAECKKKVDVVVRAEKKNSAPPAEGKTPLDLEDMKELYKRLAKETHPDKYAIYSSDIIKEKGELFNEVKQMYEKEDWFGLTTLARQLAVTLPDITDTQIEYLKRAIVLLEEKIHKTYTSAAWMWYEAPPSYKETYMGEYFTSVFGA